MRTLPLAVVPAVAVALWIAVAASVVTHLESMSRAHQQARTSPVAGPSALVAHR